MSRVLFYCHSFRGFGHLIRCLRIAQAVLQQSDCECALITGFRFFEAIDFDARISIFSLPSLSTESTTSNIHHIVLERSVQILETFRQWQPDVFVTEHYPMGYGGELVKTLVTAATEAWKTHFIWGIAYPDSTALSVSQLSNRKVKKAWQRYDSVMAYSEYHWIDPLSSCKEYLTHLKVIYTGIVTQSAAKIVPTHKPTVVVLCGGGWGGETLLRMMLELLGKWSQSPTIHFRFVVGPLGDVENILQASRGCHNIEVWSQGSVEQATVDATVAISRCGYNSTFSLINSSIPIILVPLFALSTEEQMQRATYLARLDRVWLVDERKTSAVDDLLDSLKQALNAPYQPRQLPFRTNGAEVAASWIIKQTNEISDY